MTQGARRGRALLSACLSAYLSALLVVPLGSADAQATACGRERWSVKTLVDRDAARVDLVAVPTTIAALVSLPEPRERPPADGRAELERRVFRVRAVLVERRPQSADGDIHLVLADPADRSRRLIAEVPDSACAVGGRHASDFAEVRRLLDRLPDGLELEVEGVAFWDDEHGQVGIADNGLELHPVLRLAGVSTRQDILRDEVGADAPDSSEVRVWVNTASKIYHCPGSANYGNTARGQYMPESAAVRAGARPAGGRRCR